MSEHQLHVVEISPRRMQHGKTSGERLDGEAGFDQLKRTYLIDKLGRLPRSRRSSADEGAAAEPARHEPCLFELIERAPHGASCRLEGRRQLSFWRKPVAFAVSAGLYGTLQIG